VEARPGGLRDQVQSEFSDSAAADNLGDGGEEIHGVEGDPVSDYSAGVLSFCRHGRGDEHRLAPHFADVRVPDGSDRWRSLGADPGESRWVYAIAVLLIFQVISTTRTFPLI
jgi:hypothetical protein